MKISVLGATGPTGQQLVQEALERGHDVIALVRNPEGLCIENDELKVVKVDIFKEDELTEHFNKSDVVVSCLGCRPGFLGWSRITFYVDTIKPIVAAMRKANKKRLVCMSSWCTLASHDDPRIIKYFLRPMFLRNILANMAEMEDYLEKECSDIEYTVVRPPGLMDTSSDGKDVQAIEGQFIPNVQGSISRRDVAKFMLNTLSSSTWVKKLVAVASGQ